MRDQLSRFELDAFPMRIVQRIRRVQLDFCDYPSPEMPRSLEDRCERVVKQFGLNWVPADVWLVTFDEIGLGAREN